MPIQTLDDLDLAGKTVLLRADLNVPAKDGKVTDTSRIERLKPTIEKLHEKGAKTLILSHFGRPKGTPNDDLSLEFILPELEKHWGYNVSFARDCIGEPAQTLAENLKPGEFGLLENVRFHKEEEANDTGFAQKLATPGDVFVHDAFSAAHRAHASTEGIARHLPSCAGYLMASELKALNDGLENPERPMVAIVGGAKISTKLDLLNNLIRKTDTLILGGGMANTFLHALGTDIGASLCEKDMATQAKEIYEKSKEHKCQIVLPVDAVCAQNLKDSAQTQIFDIHAIPEDQMILDIGPKTTVFLKEVLEMAKTVVWNGPLGAFEVEPFDQGTTAIAKELASLTKDGKIVSVAGGGDTLAAIEKSGVTDGLTYVSTAGGAFLEWLEGKTLPGVAAISEQTKAA